MNVRLFPIYGKPDSLWIGLALVGAMTVAISTAYVAQMARRSLSNVKTTSGSTSVGGSKNCTQKLQTQREWLGYSSTKDEELPTPKTNTPLSHSECWCSYSKRRGINNAVLRNR